MYMDIIFINVMFEFEMKDKRNGIYCMFNTFIY